jgi:hypothetical protein
LTAADLDRPFSELDLPTEAQINGNQSRFSLVTDLGRREGLTVRQVIARLGGGRGHRTFTGTPEQVADTLEQWFREGAADGFNIMAPLLPSQLETFVDQVVPILQARGLFRVEYEGTTLREHYGLDRPSSVFTTGQVPGARPLSEALGQGTFSGRRITAPVPS